MTRWNGAQEELLSAALALAKRGFLAGVGGNLALRIDDDYFAVTPSATDYYSMGPEDICVLRLKDLKPVVGQRAPSVESGMHARILRRRPECRASVHTHQPVASAFSLLDMPFAVPAVYEHRLGRRVPVCGYAPSGTRLLATIAAWKFTAGTRAIFLRNHGVVGVGSDLADASEVVVTLEKALRDWFRQSLAAPCGGELHQDVLAALIGQQFSEVLK